MPSDKEIRHLWKRDHQAVRDAVKNRQMLTETHANRKEFPSTAWGRVSFAPVPTTRFFAPPG